MKTVLKWIFGILGGLIIFSVISSYSPRNTEMLTDTPEQAAADEEKRISKTKVADCLSSVDGVITPDQEYLYSLDSMVVLQSHPNGVLMLLSQNSPNYASSSAAFLITDRDFADGAMLSGHLAAYRGTYEYINKDGVNKKVLAFKLVNKTLTDS